ncbi:hypothetical protein, partial [Ornithinibacillus halotolerans]|uniref:hypothetical protein n=1 Tax=Ornithinibacillus halotolerans TaxID=1274357 RepID=UPI001E50F7DD
YTAKNGKSSLGNGNDFKKTGSKQFSIAWNQFFITFWLVLSQPRLFTDKSSKFCGVWILYHGNPFVIGFLDPIASIKYKE